LFNVRFSNLKLSSVISWIYSKDPLKFEIGILGTEGYKESKREIKFLHPFEISKTFNVF
jgi:hypothetical protein